jgi:TPR repeat protein
MPCRGLRRVAAWVSLAVVLGGVSPAQGDLAEAEAAYKRGDFATALRVLRVEAERGNIDAQFRLAFLHANGEGVPPDQSQATRWFHQATDKLDPGAQFNVAVMYFEARFNLGLMYDGGLGLPADPVEAARWYRMAAEQGLKSAQINLAVMYRDGLGVARDNRQAYVWYALAADQDDPGAARERDRIAELLTPEEYTEAIRLQHEQEMRGYEPPG